MTDGNDFRGCLDPSLEDKGAPLADKEAKRVEASPAPVAMHVRVLGPTFA